jgi:hypothetical protein
VEPLVVTTLEGVGLTVTVIGFDTLVQPFPLVPVTVYVPEDVTVRLVPLAPFCHRYEVAPDATKVTLLPEQNVVGPPAVKTTFGLCSTVTHVIAEVLEQPLVLVTVTV